MFSARLVRNRIFLGMKTAFSPKLSSKLAASFRLYSKLRDDIVNDIRSNPNPELPRFPEKDRRPNAKNQRKIPDRQQSGPKRISDSYCELLLPFGTSEELLEAYKSIHGGLRFGKLMEDLDALAASIAYKHCDYADLTLVTAAVDRIDLLKSFDDRICNVKMRGFVTFVGRSSMEVTISVDTDESPTLGESPQWELAALAKFVFVARSQDGNEAVEVNRLILETEREKDIFKMGQMRHQYRLRRSETSLFRQPPTESESKLLHSFLIKKAAHDKDQDLLKREVLIPMKETEMTSTRICHPQERNVHNFMFGGYLMREAFELAYSTSIVFTRGARLIVTTVDDLSFVHPVAIGSLLAFTARIVYTDIDVSGQRLHVQVVADVMDPENGSRKTTNTFHFTFLAPNIQASSSFHNVIPETYTDAMLYLEGKRRLELCNEEQ